MTSIIVFDPKDGEIVQVYDWSAFEGADRPSQSQMEQEAIDLAVRNTGRQKSEFGTVQAHAKDMAEEREYKVDVQKKSVVPKPDGPRKK